jgi:hypothetical protein
MLELSHIDPRSAALLVMDYQVDTLTKFMTAAQSADAIACVPVLIAMARDAGVMVIHVVVAFPILCLLDENIPSDLRRSSPAPCLADLRDGYSVRPG